VRVARKALVCVQSLPSVDRIFLFRGLAGAQREEDCRPAHRIHDRYIPQAIRLVSQRVDLAVSRARMSCVLYVSMLSIGRERSCTVGGCGFRDKRWREGGRLSTSNTAWVRGVCATRQCAKWCPTGKRVGGENRGRMGEWEEGRRIVHTRMNGSGRW
jgi:hypothetical protein